MKNVLIVLGLIVFLVRAGAQQNTPDSGVRVMKIPAAEFQADLIGVKTPNTEPFPYRGRSDHLASPLGRTYTVKEIGEVITLQEIVRKELIWVEVDSTGQLHVFVPMVKGLTIRVEYKYDGVNYSQGGAPFGFTPVVYEGGKQCVDFISLYTVHPFLIKENANFDIYYQGIHFTFQDMKSILQEKGNKSPTPEDKKVVTNSPLVTKNQSGKSFLLSTVKSWWIDQMRQQGLFWVQKIGTKDPVFHLYFPAIGGGNMTVYYNGHYYTQKCGSDIADVDGNVTFADFPLKGMPVNYFQTHNKLNLEYYIGSNPSEDWDLFIK